MRVIKRYNNRKLYDTETRNYIALDGIAKLVAEGEEIRVVDNDTEEDITTVILSQLILDREREQRFLPIGMLSQLLRAGDKTGRRIGNTLTRPFSIPFTQILEQEIERSFKFWMDLGEEREEELLKFLERLIEQRRRARHGSPVHNASHNVTVHDNNTHNATYNVPVSKNKEEEPAHKPALQVGLKPRRTSERLNDF